MNAPQTSWDTDREYHEGKITKVTGIPGAGWVITVKSPPWLGKSAKAHMFVQALNCEQPPAVGETARLYGPNQNRVRGFVVEGRVYLYMSAAEQAAMDEKEREAGRAARQATLDQERGIRDRRRALLPPALSERVEGFLSRGGERWRRDIEGFELDVLEMAARVAALHPTHEAYYAFDALPRDEQQKVCGSDAARLSNRGFDLAVAFGGFLMGGTGKLLAYQHGAACGEGLGCELSACPATRPELFEGFRYSEALDELRHMLETRAAGGDDRVKEPAEAIAELNRVSKTVCPRSEDSTNDAMTPPKSHQIEALIGMVLQQREQAG